MTIGCKSLFLFVVDIVVGVGVDIGVGLGTYQITNHSCFLDNSPVDCRLLNIWPLGGGILRIPSNSAVLSPVKSNSWGLWLCSIIGGAL